MDGTAVTAARCRPAASRRCACGPCHGSAADQDRGADRLHDGRHESAAGLSRGADGHLVEPFAFAGSSPGSGHRAAGCARPPRRSCNARASGSAPYPRETYRDGRLVPLSRREFAVPEERMRAQGGPMSAEELPERAWSCGHRPVHHERAGHPPRSAAPTGRSGCGGDQDRGGLPHPLSAEAGGRAGRRRWGAAAGDTAAGDTAVGPAPLAPRSRRGFTGVCR